MLKNIFNFIFLFYNYVFNGNIISSEESLYNNIFLTYGLKKNSIKYVEQRMEIPLNLPVKSLKKVDWEVYLKCIYTLVPHKCSIKRRNTLNIFMLDLITSYRGWRHSRGLPVRGQRTWSNSWSCYKSNWVLRNFKITASKKNYGNVPVRDARTAGLAEYVNLTWKQQWYQEWLTAKYSRLRYKGGNVKIDMHAMANYQVMHPLKLKNLSKKQKQTFRKNYFSLGFDPGFTKPLLAELYNLNSLDNVNTTGLSSSSLVMKDERSNKKNAPKKKAEVNKKVKKKVKKSVWD